MVRRWGPFLLAWSAEAAIFCGFVRANFIATLKGQAFFCAFLVASCFFNAFVVSPWRKKPTV